MEGEPIVGAAQKVAALYLGRKPAGTVHRLRVAGGPSNLSHLEDRMKLPWRRNKPIPVYASGATVVATLPDKHPHIVPFDGDLEDTLTLKRHAVRALCALLMDRHDACLSEHQFCGLYTHYRLGDTPARLLAHPIPQATASGQDLLAIYLCQATGGASGDGLNRLEYTARLVCADRVPHRKVVAQPSSDGGYVMSIGPLLNTIEDDHYTGGIDRGNSRETVSDPEPAYARWEYYNPKIATGPLRTVPELHCLQVFGEWWVVDVDRETGAYQHVAALAVANNPDHVR